MAFWEITFNGVTQAASAWGVSGLKRSRKSGVTDTVSFKLDGRPFDSSPLPFPCDLIPGVFSKDVPVMVVKRNGLPWFSGVVTKPDPKASGRSESIDYEISGPWYWLEKTMFQQQWVAITTTGGGAVTGTTLKSEVILGQSLDGVKMNSGEVMMEVLLYAQYAFQMQPFPATVNVNHLPPPPDPSKGALPFLIGTISPNITVPYSTVRDKSCADIIRTMMKFSPNAVAWVDNSTTPPTINIAQRSGLQNKTIALYPSSGGPKLATAFNPTPRYDLQVPVVVAKFQEKNDSNGTSYSSTTVQFFPPAPPIPAGFVPPDGVTAQDAWNGCWCAQPRAWVQTIDLLGGHTTQQSADIKVIARPITAADTVAVNWALRKQPWLKSLTTIPAAVVGVNKFDWAGVGVQYINTIIDPDDPLNDPDQNPNDITITADKKGPDCNQLVSELLPGGFPPWLQQDPNDLDCAKVAIEVHLNYTPSPGVDPSVQQATAQFFVQDPNNGLTVQPPGAGVFIFHYTCKVTNADTQTYTQQTSGSGSEPVPTGFAQALYQSLQQLHFQGTITLIEVECSDRLPLGSTFNTVDGNPDWRTMQALVLNVDEDIDLGTTKVQFGPPAFLSLGEMEELFRANLGLMPSWKLQQRTNGLTTAGSNVIGDRHFADTHVVNPPSIPSAPATFPFQVLWRTNPNDSSGNTFQAKVQLNSNLLLSSNLYDTTPITGLDTWFDLDANDTIWLLSQISNPLAVTVGTPTIHSYGMGKSDYAPSAAPWSTGGITEKAGTSPNQYQTLFRKVIATSIADANGKPSIKQYIQTDLVCFNIVLDGFAAIYPYPL